jgi:hypothetical protein
MGCQHPVNCLNNRVNEIVLFSGPEKKFVDSLPGSTKQDILSSCDQTSIDVSAKNAITMASLNGKDEDYTHSTFYRVSSYSSLQSHSVHQINEDSFDYKTHAIELFNIIHDLRSKPQKYLNKMNKFFKKYNPHTNSLNLIDSEQIMLKMKSKADPKKVIEYLEKASSMSGIIRSDEDSVNVYEEEKNLPDEEVMFTISNGVKIESEFILTSAEDTLFMIFLQDKNNIKKLFENNSDNNEGITISFRMKTKTMVYKAK